MKKLLVGTTLTVVVALGCITIFGDNLKALFGMSANALAGESVVASRAVPSPLEKKGLRNFAESNGYDGPSPTSGSPAGNTHQAVVPNALVATRDDHLSTFAIDVDTASYTLGRRTLNEGQLPTPAGVRVEEWVNAFQYDLPSPTDGTPFAVHAEGAPSPWNANRTLLKVALQGRKIEAAERQPAHLVFLVDQSCSMSPPDRLPAAKESMRVLVNNLGPKDTVAIATYAGGARVVLEPTPGNDRARINSAIDELLAGGGTNMGSGMELAYQLAVRQVAAHTTTRVLVMTDGDANIGANQTADSMLASVKKYVDEGVLLTTVGFGMGNYRDATLEKLADSGNGQALYIDSMAEAGRVFGTRLTSTLQTIARDVKVQVDFDPEVVAGYRLVGYENRAVRDEDFRRDEVDGGELGAGHSVTALYELELTGRGHRFGTVHVRGQHPDSRRPFEIAAPLTREQVVPSLDRASTELRFATAVSIAADILRGNAAATDWPLNRAVDLAREATRGLPEREEFVRLAQTAVDYQRQGRAVAARRWDSNGY